MIPRVGILTVSDRTAAGLRKDVSGPTIKSLLIPLGMEIVQEAVVPDEIPAIQQALLEMSDVAGLELILTTGGTGLAPRDITPEATQGIIQRGVPGIPEAMRREGMPHTPLAMLSRGVCGIRGKTLIINLPGSPRAVKESLEVILPVLPHALAKLGGDTQDCGRI